VLTGIPRGDVHNGGGLVFGTQGELWVGTGDAGNPALAGDPASLGGKVLRIDVFGGAPGGDPVYSRGHRDVTALCVAGEALLYATDDALDGPDEVNAIAGGANYAPDGPGPVGPVVEFPAEEGGLAGCAAAPNVVFLGALDGERVHVVQLDDSGAVVDEPLEFLGGQYGRLRSVAIDAEGALWITTSNRDGIGVPGEDDDQVLRVLPPASASDSPL
jgi:glucose/arabinose dehydrogenase